jgi:putative Mg2+ transporter-C (MgtC) family protein
VFEPMFEEGARRVLITVLLCSFIGWERERRNKVAGLRTHILVGVGSTLIVLTSFYIFDIYKHQVVGIDPTRIISNIVTGIGFLCAGTIIRSGGDQVIGLTTAATLWIASGIGMAVGAGLYDISTFVTMVVFLVLVGIRSIEGKIHEQPKK